MKKSLVIFLLVALVSFVRGNVIAPRAYISEILVDSSGNWTIEIGFYEWDLPSIDSIRLVTSSGSSIITSYTVIPGGGEFCFDSLSVITNDNLANPITINPNGDLVKLISYLNPWGEDPVDSIAFGDYPGSKLSCIHEGESVMFAMYDIETGGTWGFGIDSSPTIGTINDTTGAMGNFSGIVYDLEGNPFTGGYFCLPFIEDMVMHINPDGSFSERVLSHRITFDTIKLHLPNRPLTIETYTIEPVDFCLRPESSHYQDIITTSLVTGIEEKGDAGGNVVVLSPNPFSDIVLFYFNLKNSNLSDEISLSIYSLDGRKLDRVRLLPDQKRYEWIPGGAVSSGTLIYRLEMNNKTLKSGKFIKM
jgi:hypothetical protein